MSKYTKISVTALYNDVDSMLDSLNSFLTNRVRIDTNENNTKPIKLISNNLDKIYDDLTIKGSIKNLTNKLNKLKNAIISIKKFQEKEKQLDILRLQKYNIDGSINNVIARQIIDLEEELNILERNIDNVLLNI